MSDLYAEAEKLLAQCLWPMSQDVDKVVRSLLARCRELEGQLALAEREKEAKRESR